VNRLTSATDTSWSRSFYYDEYGNMSVTGNSNVSSVGSAPAFGSQRSVFFAS
jgi:YD repeat-containing protein